jgi:ComF family protein
MKKIKNIFRFILDVLLPPRCFVCRKTVYKENGLCSECFSQFHFLSNQCCPICGRPYTFPVENSKRLVCVKCLKNPPKLKRLKAVFAYDDFSKSIILSFKHGDRTDIAPYFGKLLYQYGKEILSECDYIIPVPLHWSRLLKRKYNQSSLIAKELEKISGKKCLYNNLKRIKQTPSQGHKTKKERFQNIKNALKVSNPEPIKGKTIVLIDDVYTTGATLNECARVLLASGAKSVMGLVVARVCYFE